MNNIVKSSSGSLSLADRRQVIAQISDGSIDRQGDIVVQSGIDTKSFMKAGGTVLWNHNSAQPIAKCIRIGVEDGALRATIQFPTPGTSAKADEVFGLIRAGVINATSIGFQPKKSEPIDPAHPWDGKKYNQIEIMEISVVAVPANPSATVIARSNRKKTDGGAYGHRGEGGYPLLSARAQYLAEVDAEAKERLRDFGDYT